MTEYTGFRVDLWRRISELISSVYLNSLDDITSLDEKGLRLFAGGGYSWASMGADEASVRAIFNRWRAYQRVLAEDVLWRDGSDERAERLVAEMERVGQPWTVRPLREAFAPTDKEVRASSSTFTNTYMKAFTADSLRATYEAMARMQDSFMMPVYGQPQSHEAARDPVPSMTYPPSTPNATYRTTATDVRISLDGVPIAQPQFAESLTYTATPTTGEVQGTQRPIVPIVPVPPAMPVSPPAPPPTRWALLEPDETADPEAVVQAWREAQARRKAKPRVPAYHETILDLTECSLLDAVLR